MAEDFQTDKIDVFFIPVFKILIEKKLSLKDEVLTPFDRKTCLQESLLSYS